MLAQACSANARWVLEAIIAAAILNTIAATQVQLDRLEPVVGCGGWSKQRAQVCVKGEASRAVTAR
jgi:hypothetical protein